MTQCEPTTTPHNRATQTIRQMEVTVKGCDENSYVIEVGVDETMETMRQKVASAVGLAEDSFHMGFGGKDEGEDITQLSAGDIVVLTSARTKKDDAIAALRDLGETELTTQRLEQCQSDARLVHLLLQAGAATVLRERFLEDCAFQELDLSDVSCVTDVGSFFLRQSCRVLTAVDLSGWDNVRRVGFAFVHGCTLLTTLDLSGWSSITHVGNHFLGKCTALRTVDLSGWKSVSLIEAFFMTECVSLRTLDLSGWNNVTAVGRSFLYGCCSLTELNLSGWDNVTQVGNQFLYRNTSLASLDLSGWSNVTHVGVDFLVGCNFSRCSINVSRSSSIVSGRVDKAREKPRCVCM